MLHTLIIHQHKTFTNSSFFSQGGDDFVSQQYQLHFPAGQTRAEFTVVITNDDLIEAMETFQLLLSIPQDIISKGVQVGPNSAATVTIMDNDGELYSTTYVPDTGTFNINISADIRELHESVSL